MREFFAPSYLKKHDLTYQDISFEIHGTQEFTTSKSTKITEPRTAPWTKKWAGNRSTIDILFTKGTYISRRIKNPIRRLASSHPGFCKRDRSLSLEKSKGSGDDFVPPEGPRSCRMKHPGAVRKVKSPEISLALDHLDRIEHSILFHSRLNSKLLSSERRFFWSRQRTVQQKENNFA